MAPAIDRDALHAKLVTAVDAWAKGCEATVRPLTARLIARLKNSKATTPIAKIVDDEMRKLGIDAKLRKSMRELVIDAVAHGYGILPTMMADRDKVGDKLMTTPWSGDDMTLSERLHQNAKHMRAIVAGAIQTARRQGQTFTQAARVLYDGYNSGQRVIDAAKLPQYMQNVEQAARHVLAGGDLREFQRDMRKAQRAVDRLAKGGAPNKALKSAYQQMLNAAEAGSQKHLERAIRTAVEERSRYHAERIARTEAARAYFDGFIARNANDDDVIGYKWTIGGRHPKTDICDDYAAADNFHMGAGVYPKDKVPAYPAHPHCLCHLSEVYADEVPGYEKSKRATGVIEGRVEAEEIAGADAAVPEKQEELNALDTEIQTAQKEIDELRAKHQFAEYSEDLLRKTAAEYRAEGQVKSAELVERAADARHKIDQLVGKIANANARKISINPLGSTPPPQTKTWKKIQGAHGIKECYNTVNPNYSTGKPEWTENCQKCVVAYEMRRRGLDVEAMPNLDNAGARWRTLGFKDMQWTKLAGTGTTGIRDLMQFWGDGSRAIVVVQWKGENVGHAFIAENVGGKIKYICPQSSDDKYKWASCVKENRTEICRIDSLEPADSIVECCKPR